MKNVSKILWGVFFIILGIVIGLKSLNILDINIFFRGWWTLFIIIPCFINLFNEREGKLGNLIGLIIGVSLLLSAQNIFEFRIIAKLIVPFIFVMIGLSFLLNNTIKGKISEKVAEGKKNGLESIVATFAEQKIDKTDESFKGANLDAVFGGIKLDLRDANLEEETVIEASAIFGGIEIIVPKGVNVKVKSTPIFGGVDNHISNKKEEKKTIYIEAFCLFGGLEIK